MSKQMILGLVAMGGFVVLGAGLYQLGGKGDQGKDVPLKASADASKTEEKTAAPKRTNSADRDRKPIERKPRENERAALEKKTPASETPKTNSKDSDSPETLGKSVSTQQPGHSPPAAEDFSPKGTLQDRGVTGADSVDPSTKESVGPPTGGDSDDPRLSALLGSAQPTVDESASDTKSDSADQSGSATTRLAPRGVGQDDEKASNTKEAEAAAASMKTYRIARGDTLALISEIHYGSQKHVDRILAANPQIKDPDKVGIGMELRIPSLDGPLPTKSEAAKKEQTDPAVSAKSNKDKPATESYVVQDGDTLYSIADRMLGDGTRWQEIFDLNKSEIGDEPSQLKMGQKIKLPESSKKTADSGKQN